MLIIKKCNGDIFNTGLTSTNWHIGEVRDDDLIHEITWRKFNTDGYGAILINAQWLSAARLGQIYHAVVHLMRSNI